MDSDEIVLELQELADPGFSLDFFGFNKDDIHEKTNALFFKSLEAFYGKEKLDYLCKRYYHQSFEDIKQKGDLSGSFVPKIAVGASFFRVEDLLPHLNGKEIEDLTYDELEMIFKIINPIPFKGRPIKPWIDTNPSGSLGNDRALMDQEIVQLNARCKELDSTEAKDEMLVKGIAYRELEKGDILCYGKSYYKVYDVLVTGNGVVAYALLPLIKDQEDQQPIIVFRGSLKYPAGLDSASSLINNFEEEIGESGYSSARPYLQRWLLDPNFCKDKVKLIGFSLGGAHAQHFLADYPEKICEVVTFSSPGVSLKTAEIFLKKSQDLDHTISIKYFRVVGDPFDLSGEAFVGMGVDRENITIEVGYITPDPDNVLLTEAVYAHTHRYFSDITPYTREDIDGPKVQAELVSDKRADYGLVERIRSILGPYLVAPLARLFRAVYRFFIPSRAEEKMSRVSKIFFHPSVKVEKVNQRPSSLVYS